MKRCLAAICLVLAPVPCIAWGNLAHRTIALLAQKHFTVEASKYTKDLLGNESIDVAAIWADEYKTLPEGRSTGSWHFVDARDDPPATCNVEYHRDCQPNRTCIIEAIQNTTERLRDAMLPVAERKIALRFVLHLVGDVHCPLHAESISRGGNDIPVLYHGETTNLHFIWDVSMPNDIADNDGSDEAAVAKRWANQLNSRGDLYQRPDLNFGDEALQGNYNFQHMSKGLALSWAREANVLVCTDVLKGGIEAFRNKELSGAYFNTSRPIIEYQMFLAGARLAMLINSLAHDGESEVRQEREELR